MSNSNLASENSAWLKEYVKSVTDKKAASDKKKGPTLMITFACIFGVAIGYLIYSGGLDDPQKFNVIKILGVIAGVLILFSILMIALGRKKQPTNATVENLNELLKSVEEVREFDAQMKAEPRFVIKNDANHFFAATKDYFYKRTSDMGNDLYLFIRLSDIASLHYRGTKATGHLISYIIDLRDKNGNVLVSGNIENGSLLDDLRDELKSAIAGLEAVEEAQ